MFVDVDVVFTPNFKEKELKLTVSYWDHVGDLHQDYSYITKEMLKEVLEGDNEA